MKPNSPLSIVHRVVAAISDWYWVIGSGGLLWVALSWAAAKVASIAENGFGAIILVGLAATCTALFAVGFILISWRYFNPVHPTVDNQSGNERNPVDNKIVSKVETMVRLERDGSVPHQWRPIIKKNVFTTFQIWNFKPMVVFHEYAGGLPKADVTIPDLYPTLPASGEPRPEQIDTFFVVLDKPQSYSGIKIEAFGHIFPKHDIYCVTERTAIIYLREQLPPTMTIFEIQFLA